MIGPIPDGVMYIQWWWDQSPYVNEEKDIRCEKFGRWLKERYIDANKLERPSNRGYGRS